MRIITLLAISALSIAVAAPAVAQDAMKSDSMKSGTMKMSAAMTKKMDHCNSMSHDMMMKNKSCMKMMKMHPDMMKGDGAMMAH